MITPRKTYGPWQGQVHQPFLPSIPTSWTGRRLLGSSTLQIIKLARVMLDELVECPVSASTYPSPVILKFVR